jgi:hypothetical protein
MANTSKKIVLTLKQVNSITFVPNGNVEPNDPSSAEYIPPYPDTVSCPISNSFACPLPIFTGYTGSIGFEFSLFDSVVTNPSVKKVSVVAISQSISRGSSSFSLPNSTPTYFSGSIGSLASGSYTVNIQYISGSTIVNTCSNTASISVK